MSTMYQETRQYYAPYRAQAMEMALEFTMTRNEWNFLAKEDVQALQNSAHVMGRGIGRLVKLLFTRDDSHKQTINQIFSLFESGKNQSHRH